MIKLMIRGALLGAAVLAVSACFGISDGTGSKAEGNALIHYEPDNYYETDDFLHQFFNEGKDTVSVNKFLSYAHMTHYSTVDETTHALVGGFALCIGADMDASPERKPSRFAVYDKGGHQESLAYVVFHDTTAALMPEHVVKFYLPTTASSIQTSSMYVQNVQAVVQAVKHGVGLADGPFTGEDYLKLVVTGSFRDKVTDTVETLLVDGTKMPSEWTKVDLTKLGTVDVVDLRLVSSRPDLPLYCCIDSFSYHYAEIYP